jgi:hypothetical protein
MRPLTTLLSQRINSPATDRRRAVRPRPAEKRPSLEWQRPRLEALEGRVLLSTYYVDYTQDTLNVPSGYHYSLRSAINQALARDNAKAKGLKIETGIKAGQHGDNHNEALARDNAQAKGLKVKTGVKSGGLGGCNHNEMLTRDSGVSPARR